MFHLLSWQEEGWKLNRVLYYQEGWLATGNARGIVGVTYSTSHNKKTSDIPPRTNYNLRGHRAEVSQNHLLILKRKVFTSIKLFFLFVSESMVNLELNCYNQKMYYTNKNMLMFSWYNLLLTYESSRKIKTLQPIYIRCLVLIPKVKSF